MAEDESDGGPCLIYDERVVRAISRLADEPEFEFLTEIARSKSPSACQIASYGEYLIAAGAAARRLGVTALQIEQFLFDNGGSN